jgi:toxin-antitoxin system PIN domain toxin
MQAIDTNILIHAEVESSERHGPALKILQGLAEGALPWAIPWPCIYEFLRVVTHPRVFHPPVPLNIAMHDLRKVLASPSLFLLAETARHASVLDQVLSQAGATGNLIHDAHIVALCLEHGVAEIITGDRDFTRFAGLKIINPFAAQ